MPIIIPSYLKTQLLQKNEYYYTIKTHCVHKVKSNWSYYVCLHCWRKEQVPCTLYTDEKIITIYWPMILMCPCIIDFIGGNGLQSIIHGHIRISGQ